MNAYYLLGAVSSIAVSMSENRHKEEKERLALCLVYSIIVAVARVIAVRNWVFACATAQILGSDTRPTMFHTLPRQRFSVLQNPGASPAVANPRYSVDGE